MLARIKEAREKFHSMVKILKNDKPDSPITGIMYIQSIVSYGRDQDYTIEAHIEIVFPPNEKQNDERQKVEEILLSKFKYYSTMCMIGHFPLNTSDLQSVAELLYPAYLSDKFMQQLFGKPKSLKETCVGFIEKAYQAKIGFWATNKENIANLNNDIKGLFSEALRKEVGFVNNTPPSAPSLQTEKNEPEQHEHLRLN